eukprot:6235952-Amphidinium_carterae.1
MLEEADWMTDLTCPFDCDRVIANMDAVLKGRSAKHASLHTARGLFSFIVFSAPCHSCGPRG